VGTYLVHGLILLHEAQGAIQTARAKMRELQGHGEIYSEMTMF
jgi:hypothetical protein